jgi:hypothetical protein
MFRGVPVRRDLRAALLPILLVSVAVLALLIGCLLLYAAGRAYTDTYVPAPHRPVSDMATLVTGLIVVAAWATGVGAILVLVDLSVLLLALAYPPYFFLLPRGQVWHWGLLLATIGTIEMFSLPKFLG